MTKTKQWVLSALVLAISAGGLYILTIRLIAQVNHLKAQSQMRNGDYPTAIASLEKALDYWQSDDAMWRDLGLAYLELASRKPIDKAYIILRQAQQNYQTAIRLSPLESEGHYGLARSTEALQDLFLLQGNDAPNPYNALPHYQRALQLRPNGVSFHIALCAYLYKNGYNQAFLETLTNLARIYPPAYDTIKTESYWTAASRQAYKQGIEQAIEQEILRNQAHRVMASILEKEGDLDGALHHFSQSIQASQTEPTASQYYNLGRLKLINGFTAEAAQSFLQAMAQHTDKSRLTRSLYSLYRSQHQAVAFIDLFAQLRRHYRLQTPDLLWLARTHIDLQQYDAAQEILAQINAVRPLTEAYYWLAKIAEKQKDWDAMELAIQKATVLEPDNSRYRRIFAKALQRQNKKKQAAEQRQIAKDLEQKKS